ncbi:nucleotidyltransferase domain-containing protein [Chitinophagaceae bacterium LB-8]|uniref:Nucleotidyltransferase domain-containing protein n=1 Tax=Paraflavisolibacter caeni TaxID=2982496 RepID=A0A9X2XYL4_9BACT|nr:nucleotidyltransferase domain-containing protein [Paraflavisolibacter caeni]MCU7551170.1 nucleotidyltransferase domain-containing protein [Paraflavisolibacter caeni]
MSLIDQYTRDIQKLCEQHKVRRLYAFGSVLTDRFKKDSDVDFIVDFEPLDVSQYADNYFDLKFALEDTLHRSVDLLEEKTIRNPYFRKAIEHQRQLIHPTLKR